MMMMMMMMRRRISISYRISSFFCTEFFPPFLVVACPLKTFGMLEVEFSKFSSVTRLCCLFSCFLSFLWVLFFCFVSLASSRGVCVCNCVFVVDRAVAGWPG